MSNPIDPLGQSPRSTPKSSVPTPRTGPGNRILATSTGFFGRLLSIPDRNPKMRYVFDIAIIAIAVISMVGILVASQGQGLLLFGLIPGFIFGTLGVIMLISDVANTPRSQKIADTITAILLPFILLGIASALIASAYFSVGGSALIFANPQFIMGFMTIGLALVSLSKVTFQHFKTEALIKAQQKVSEISEQSLTSGAPSEKDIKRVAQERKRDFVSDARREHESQESRTYARRRHISRSSQGELQHRPKNQVEAERADLDYTPEYDEYSELLQGDFSFLHDTFNPFSPAYVPPQTPDVPVSSAPKVPLSQTSPSEFLGTGPITPTPRKVHRISSTSSSSRFRNSDEEEERQERESQGDDESSDVENSDSQGKQNRKKKKKKS
ncbi:conserved hypothetical protein [Chlamydia felis Fe/C-56]|uniref:Uncharacterized protein n=1 Tax=Chlamydia felis (strain Fe/C-56) TaxID=264202 RepID=Q253Q3_CHLFF|nr:IncV family inclusion membrane protein [Chlamydia felis]BAE81485.1 conserved hypothetical protein [Chlamydia felis Fe/C-56]